uniref:Uncharacterized protein n=1 Tax=Cacopsylla melanoneura TaxID=428564 RepID=A0A8D8SMD0_9HEMI
MTPLVQWLTPSLRLRESFTPLRRALRHTRKGLFFSFFTPKSRCLNQNIILVSHFTITVSHVSISQPFVQLEKNKVILIFIWQPLRCVSLLESFYSFLTNEFCKCLKVQVWLIGRIPTLAEINVTRIEGK